jgi:hypothetical protein
MRRSRERRKVSVILKLPGVVSPGSRSKDNARPLDGEYRGGSGIGTCKPPPVIARGHVLQQTYRVGVEIQPADFREVTREGCGASPARDTDICFGFLLSTAEFPIYPAFRNRDELRDSARQIRAIQPV